MSATYKLDKHCPICGKLLADKNKTGYCSIHRDRTGASNPFYGKTFSKETLDKIKEHCAESSKKLWENEEYRNKVVIRIPFIRGYNTESDIKRSEEQIRKMGFDRIDEFNYSPPSELSRIPKSGRKICDFLKRIRQQAAAKNNILYTPTDCSYEGECIGTCPKCEKELEFLINRIKS